MELKFTEEDLETESINSDEGNPLVDDLLGKLQQEIKEWCRDINVFYPKRINNSKQHEIVERVGELIADGNF